ncbi:MAG TPA: methyltransferase domain-containing protein [Candidatus Methylomirabilis sp.]|nr:methyltransferase domain-containing protein [Candidatus Methylomirabilis sp.]
MKSDLRFKIRVLAGLLNVMIVSGCAGMSYENSAAPPDFHALVASPDRSAADREEDVRRKPEGLLAFTGVQPGMKVLEIGAGNGYTAELLARAVGPRGVVYAQNAASREAFEARMKTPAMKNVVALIRPFDDPAPPQVKDLDLITVILIYHDTTYLPVDRAKMDRRFFELLKPGGHLIVVDHSAQAGAGTSVGKSLHRIEETALRREVEAAGFRLEAESNFLRNPADPRDNPFRDMTMPTDRFALKFVKP